MQSRVPLHRWPERRARNRASEQSAKTAWTVHPRGGLDYMAPETDFFRSRRLPACLEKRVTTIRSDRIQENAPLPDPEPYIKGVRHPDK